MRLVDQFDGGLGWICDEAIARTSHALATPEGMWLVDPVDDLPPDVEDVRGVIQLLDRHNRDCATVAARFGVPHVRAYESAAPPFEMVPVRDGRWWKEVALWWPERRVLVCADALGTLGYFVAPGERIGVHPLLRLTPPRALGAFDPERILVGHGAGIHAGATDALRAALRTSRRRLPAALAQGARRALRARRGTRSP